MPSWCRMVACRLLDVEGLLHRSAAQFVGGANADAALDAAAGQPHGETVGVMVPADARGRTRWSAADRIRRPRRPAWSRAGRAASGP